MSETLSLTLPEVIPVYPLREMVAFPYMVISLYLTHEELATYEESAHYSNLIVLVKTRGGEAGNLAPPLHEIGTVCKITQLSKQSEGGGKAVLEGLARVRLQSVIQDSPVILAQVELVREFVEKSMVSEALVSSLNALLKIALSYGRPLPDDVMKMIDYIDNPARLSDLVALYVNLPLDEQQALLETVDPIDRLKKVYMHLTSEVQRLQIKGEVQAEVTKKVGKTQNE